MKSMSKRAFSLVEVVVVMAIVGITAGVATASFSASINRRSDINAARQVVAEMNRLRARGLAGRLVDPAATPPPPAPPPGGPAFAPPPPGGGGGAFARQGFRQTGVRVLNDHTLVFFGDPNPAAGGDEETLNVLDLDDLYPAARLTITAPSIGQELRFERNATLDLDFANAITMRSHASDRTLNVTVTAAGLPRLRL